MGGANTSAKRIVRSAPLARRAFEALDIPQEELIQALNGDDDEDEWAAMTIGRARRKISALPKEALLGSVAHAIDIATGYRYGGSHFR